MMHTTDPFIISVELKNLRLLSVFLDPPLTTRTTLILLRHQKSFDGTDTCPTYKHGRQGS